MPRLKIILPAVFVGLVGVLIVWFTLTKPRVLILQSYYTDYSWVRDVNTGINRVLGSRSTWEIRHYYMDTKRHPWPEYKNKTGVSVRRVIDEWKPDLVIAIDDDAQKYAMAYYANHPTVKVVFSGVNLDPKVYGYDTAKNVTGVLERLPLRDIRTAMLDYARLSGRAEDLRVAFIDDKSETVQGDAGNIRAFDWGPVKMTQVTLLDDFEEFKAAVKGLEGKADILMMDGYRKFSRSKTDRTLVPPTEVQKWVNEHSPLPTLGVNGFFAEDGGMLAIGTSPFEQGELAARMAVEIIDGKKLPKDVPQSRGTQFIVAMRASRMVDKHFEVPRVYEAAARSVDKWFP